MLLPRPWSSAATAATAVLSTSQRGRVRVAGMMICSGRNIFTSIGVGTAYPLSASMLLSTTTTRIVRVAPIGRYALRAASSNTQNTWGSSTSGDDGGIDYTKMMKSMGVQKYYSLDSPLDLLPEHEAGLSAELRRLELRNDSRQMLNLLTLWSRSNGLPIRQDHCNTLLDTCLKAKDVTTTNSFITDSNSGTGTHASNPAILRRALRIFGAAGACEDAQNVLQLLSQVGETVVWNDYNLVLHAAATAGKINVLMGVKRELQREGFPPALSFYNLALKTCVVCRNHGKAVQFFDEMSANGLKADRYTWGSLIQSYVYAGDVRGASDILDKLIAENSSGISPQHFNHVMKAYAERGDSDKCFQLLGYMQASKTKFMRPDEYSYGICLDVAAGAGDKRKVIEIIRNMYSAGLSLNHATWRTATAPFGKTLDAEGLRDVIDIVLSQGTQSTFVIWRDLIGILSRRGQTEQTYRVLQEMRVKHKVAPNQSCYIRVVRTLCNTKVPVSATSRLQPNQEALPEGKNSRGSSSSGTIDTCTTVGGDTVSTDHAPETVNTITPVAPPVPRDFTSLMGSLPTLGYKDESKVRTTSLFSPQGGTESPEIAKGNLPRTMFDWVSGREVIREMRRAGVKPTANIWRYVLQACADSEDCVEGESTLTNMVGLLGEMYEEDQLFPRYCDWQDLIGRVSFDEPSSSRGSGGSIRNSSINNRRAHNNYGMALARRDRIEDKEEYLFFRLLNSFTPEYQEKYLAKAVTALCGETMSSSDGDNISSINSEGQEKALYILSHLKPYQRTHLAAWHVLLGSYASIGDARKCHRMLKSFESVTAHHAPISLWLRLIDALAFNERQFSKAFEVADELLSSHEAKFGNYHSIDPDAALLVPFFNRMLEISVLANDPGNFVRYFEMLSIFNLEPNLDTYRIIGMQHIRNHRLDQFDDCIGEMLRVIRDGIRSVSSVSSGIGSQENKHYVDRIDTASMPMGKMRVIGSSKAEAASDLHHSNSISQPMEMTTSLATAVVGEETVVDMDELLVQERARRSLLVNQYFPVLLDVLVEHEYWGVAEQLIPRIRADLSVNCEQLCSRYMSKLAAKGKIEDAVVYAEACILGDGITILRDMSVWHALLHQAREQGCPMEAQFAIEKMQFALNISPDVFCWSLLISTYGDAGRLDDAAKTLKDMMHSCDEKPPSSCWTVLFEAYKARQDPEGCHNLIQHMYRYKTGAASAAVTDAALAAPAGEGCNSNRLNNSSIDNTWSLGGMFKDYIFQEKFDDPRSSVFIEDMMENGSGTSSSSNGDSARIASRARPRVSTVSVSPTLLHWYHTIHAFALYRGGKAAYSELCYMRGTCNVIPSIQCYTCVLHQLIDEDDPELIGDIVRIMHADNVNITGETMKKIEAMYRYDIVLEVIEEVSKKYK